MKAGSGVDDRPLKVAVFGSWRTPKAQVQNEHRQQAEIRRRYELSKNTFDRACFELGRSLAEAGATVIVASDSTSTTDYQVAMGVLASVDASSNIDVVRSCAGRSSRTDEDCLAIYTDELAGQPERFGDVDVLNDIEDWEDVHDYVLEKADCVVVVGGGNSSYRAAVKTLAAEKLIVPIGVFGGAGREVLQLLNNIRDTYKFPKYEYRETLGAARWDQAQLDTSLYALGVKSDPSKRSKIFINYRRVDTSMAASVIQERLATEFSAENIFRDVESIALSERFDDVIQSALDQSLLVLVLIGPEWVMARDDVSGGRRIDNDNDYVRREIEAALRDSVPILPVCINGAEVPPPDVLPDSIRELANLNAALLSADRFSEDLSSLVGEIRLLVSDLTR